MVYLLHISVSHFIKMKYPVNPDSFLAIYLPLQYYFQCIVFSLIAYSLHNLLKKNACHAYSARFRAHGLKTDTLARFSYSIAVPGESRISLKVFIWLIGKTPCGA